MYSGRIALDMMLSPAWQALSARQKTLYLHMTIEVWCQHAMKEDRQHPQFIFNRGIYYEKYHLYGSNDRKSVRMDICALVRKGFIEVVEYNQVTRESNKYMMSSRWKSYIDDEHCDEPIQSSKTYLLGRGKK